MKVIGIIPARFNSSRFPGKPLALINGKTMINLVYAQAKKVNAFSKVIVATDDDRIYDHVKSFGGEVMMTSPNHLSGTDRCGEIINKLNEDFDVVVNIQGDEPFIQPEQLEKLINAFNEPEVEIATLGICITDAEKIFDPNIVKVVFNETGNALYFSRFPIPFIREMDKEKWAERGSHFKHLGIYAFHISVLQKIIKLQPSRLEKAESLEQLRWLENGFKIKVVETEIDTMGIDTPEDLKNI
ncbi:MAG: 3-deoxy-manno-octulosonate cytidylyltransferase [Chitinophagales bacterium]